jgi:dTMP kinase
MPAGLFVAFEGGEGAGKSSQVVLLAQALREHGRTVLVTREPGDSRIGPGVRQMVLDDPGNAGLSPKAEALLYAADRAEHVAAMIRPALGRGEVVLTDRYIDSSLAYQGAGRALPEDEVEQLNAWATDGLLPELTVLLDIEPALGLRRAGAAPDRLESEPLEFHRRVRDHFLALAARRPQAYLVIAADQSREDLAAHISKHVLEMLG